MTGGVQVHCDVSEMTSTLKSCEIRHKCDLIHSLANARARFICAGDVVLARIENLGQHRNLDILIGGRHLFPSDEIVVCCGNRYAPDKYESEVPRDFSSCGLVAAGGMASKALNRRDSIKQTSVIKLIGLVAEWW